MSDNPISSDSRGKTMGGPFAYAGPPLSEEGARRIRVDIVGG